MEYSKDIIFNTKYNEVKNTLETGFVKRRRTSNIILKLKNYKFITVIIMICTLLIIFDIILIANFIRLLQIM